MIHKDFRLLWHLRWLKPVIRMAGNSDAKKVQSDLTAFVNNWVKDAPPSDRALFALPAIRTMLEDEIREAYRQGAAGWFGDVFAMLDWGFELESITSPVTVFHGGADEIVYPTMGQAIAARVRNGRLHLIPNEGHLCVFRHWETVLNSVD